MIITRILCIFFLGIIFIKIKRFKESLLKLDNLFNLVLSTTILITTFKLAGFQHDFGIKFNVAYLLLVLMFYFGYEFGQRLKINCSDKINYNNNNFKIVVNGLTIMIVGCFLYTWWKLGTPPGFGGTVSRNQYYIGKLEGVYVLIYFLIYALMYDFFNKKYLGKSFWVYMTIVMILILARANKFTIVYLVLVTLVLYNLYVKKIKIKNLIYVGIIGIIIFVASFSLFYNKVNNSTLDDRVVGYKMKLPEQLAFLTDIYLYVACNYENINYYMENFDDWTYGYYSFKAVIDLVGLDKVYVKINPEIDDYWNYSLQFKTLNTGSIFRDFYLDFSFLGIVFFGFFVGAISGSIEKLLKKNKYNITYCFWYCLIGFSIFLVFFTNFFSNILFFINFIFAFLVKEFIMLRKDNIV